MSDPAGLPVWRPGTHVRYWLNTREGDGEVGQTQGSPFTTSDGTAVVYIAGHEHYLPLARVEALGTE
ncbi:MAG TPA: hypothetical protein VGN22_03615 [Pseudonocardia sp.]